MRELLTELNKNTMNKEQIISKIVNDLPVRELRNGMSDEEWYGWFEECWDKAINYNRSCESDSEQLCEHPMSERADIVGSSRTYCLKCSTSL